MIKRELKSNLKSFIIWTLILIAIFLVVFLVYPFILTDDSVKNLDEMMKVFPPELLKAFNMDLSSINSVYGWLKTEGFMFVLIIVGIYSSILGSNILLKEESDKTIEYIGFLPIKRNYIVTSKIIVSIFYIFLMVITLGIFNYIGLTISGDFNKSEYLLLSISPLLIALPLFSLNLFISTFMHKTKKTIGISLGLVFVFYIINVLSELSKNIEFIKYFSIYTLANIRNIISNGSINILVIILSIFITGLFTSLSYIRYNKKELI